jgi:hypothetical protein
LYTKPRLLFRDLQLIDHVDWSQLSQPIAARGDPAVAIGLRKVE